ncbi:ATPase [hydrothermal vent metagenome]|uniref:ATPase n=2 Tax=hydrothermal vent metagenome TaxID=652676 RepID=A0A3B0VZ80_9ZZZZ
MHARSPLQIYQEKLAQGQIKQDILQNEVVLGLEDLYQSVSYPKRHWLFKTKREFNGLYIHGSVGRGKTFLMDLFVDCIDENKIRRQHFHQFMLWFHQQLRTINNQQNPIDIVIKKLSAKISVLCLDEFLVHDITDAMLLAGVLLALEKYKISLITTSNVNPIDLYAGGLQRKKFLPAIDWIQQNMQVLQLNGDYDYRMKPQITAKKWLHPINDKNLNYFEQLFSQLASTQNLHIAPITINKRQLNIIKRSSSHIMFELDTLCKQPRNAHDFIKLAEQYESIFIVINAQIPADERNIASRFITLIDVLYDNATELYVLATIPFTDIYLGQELSFEMQRTISRLTEMQQ